MKTHISVKLIHFNCLIVLFLHCAVSIVPEGGATTLPNQKLSLQDWTPSLYYCTYTQLRLPPKASPWNVGCQPRSSLLFKREMLCFRRISSVMLRVLWLLIFPVCNRPILVFNILSCYLIQRHFVRFITIESGTIEINSQDLSGRRTRHRRPSCQSWSCCCSSIRGIWGVYFQRMTHR